MSSNKTGFSAIDLTACQQIIDAGGGYNELAAFIILACHTSGTGRAPHRLSTAGAKAVSTKTGISYRKAGKALDWLLENKVIERAPGDPSTPRARQVRWTVANYNEHLVYIPHSLIHGVSGETPPLMRIYAESQLGPAKKVHMSRLDTLWVLVRLYQHQLIEDFGGVDPNVIWAEWDKLENDEFAEAIQSAGVTFTPFTPHQEHTYSASHNFVVECLGENSEENAARFWHAFRQLKVFGLYYDVLQCWDSDPREDDNAEIAFPIYVFDEAATDPYIGNDINRVIRLHIDYPDETLYFREDGKLVFFCPSLDEEPFVLGAIRMRYRASTQDTGVGLELQKSMVKSWGHLLSECYEGTIKEIYGEN